MSFFIFDFLLSECHVFIDVFGSVVTMYERGMEDVDGMTLREAVIVIDNRDVSATRYTSLLQDLFIIPFKRLNYEVKKSYWRLFVLS